MTPFIPEVPKLSYQPFKIEVVEEKYNATFVGDFCLKTKNGWTEAPIAIFYQPTPINPEYSNYFGLYVSVLNKILICDGASAFSQPIIGAVADNGEIIISRYRHDCVTSQDGSVMIDGGRDYLRTNTDNIVHLQMIDGKMTIIPKRRTKLNRI